MFSTPPSSPNAGCTTGPREVWNGLTKNAIEGVAAPARILPFTMVLIGGQVLPFLLLGMSTTGTIPEEAQTVSAAAVFASYIPRILGVWRFGQSLLGALLHPLGVTLFMVAQWYALLSWLAGRTANWKGRKVPLRRFPLEY